MPEGDTVWRAARSLDRALAGQVLTRTDFRVPALATVDLAGTRCGRPSPAASTCSPGSTTATSLDSAHPPQDGGRRGTSTPRASGGAVPPTRPGSCSRLPTGSAVGFTLGIVELIARVDEDQAVGHLGPDLLGPDWDEAEAVRRLAAQPDRPIGEALLDQRNLAGIGNIYRNELCFLAGVHPSMPVNDRARPARGWCAGPRPCSRPTRNAPSRSTTGDLRPGHRSWVYRQRQCRRCETPIVLVGQDERDRAIYWCPSCQPS